MRLVAETEDTFFRPALFLVATGTAKGRVELVLVQRRFQRVGLHQFGVPFAVFPRIDVVLATLFVDVDDQVQPSSLRA